MAYSVLYTELLKSFSYLIHTIIWGHPVIGLNYLFPHQVKKIFHFEILVEIEKSRVINRNCLRQELSRKAKVELALTWKNADKKNFFSTKFCT